ncbi:MAG: CheR family methyltransferase [Verrucomicrobiales bacterium]
MGNALTPSVEETLRTTIGLDVQSIGASTISRAVRDRLKVLQLSDPDAYEQMLVSSDEERQILIESLVVPETWFLRHPESFNFLVSRVNQLWPPNPPGSKIRVLSIPCSTGEEPYSIAIALLREGYDPAAFEIEAFDISHHSLTACRKAAYGRNSFREASFNKVENWFESREGRFHLKDSVKSMVKFRWANVVAPDFNLPAGSYDFIFCRNLLIYLTSSAQQQVVQTLRRALRDTGCFFSGPAEAAILSQNGFSSLKTSLTFAFEKASSKPVQLEPLMPAVALKPARVIPIVPRNFPPPAPSLHQANRTRLISPAVELSAEKLLEHARERADRGDFATAAELCFKILEKNQAASEAYQILGLVHDAQGRVEEAIDCYKKALYLNPSHQETLLHLALLKHKTGDIKGAQVLQQRASRLPSSMGISRSGSTHR